MRAKSVFEELGFERTKDIKKDLNLGKAAKIREAMKELGVTDYEILPDFTLVIKHGHEDDGDINYEGDYLPSVLYNVPEIIFDNPSHVNLEYLKKLPDRTWFQNKGNIYLGSLEHLPSNVTFQPTASYHQKVDLSSIKKENIPPSVYFGNRFVLHTANDFNILESIDFERTGDVKKGLGIGKREKIHRWFREHAPDVEYEIGDDFSIYVDGNLDLEGSRTKLPENLHVTGNLYLGFYKLSSLPKGLNVGRTLYLGESNVSELPENLNVGENIILWRSKVSELPKNMNVGGYLDIGNTQVKEIPESLNINGKIFIDKDQDIEIPENLKHKIGYL